MRATTSKQAIFAGIATLLLALPAHASINKSVTIPDGGNSTGESSVNGSLTIGDNATVTGNLSTVNGTIRVGSGAAIESASTVNGSIRISSDARTEDLETVNGSIKLGERVAVSGSIEAVNGSISLDNGSSTTRSVENVNGDIALHASTINGDITTVNGDVELSDASTVTGNIRIEKPSGWGWNNDRKRNQPKIVIGPGSRVQGKIILEREVKLYISESAEVGGVEGVMSMDDAVRFSGNRP